MARLFAFLLKLSGEEFYGEIRIRFQKGRVHGQIQVNQFYVEDTLPEPNTADPRYQAAVAQAVKGVGLPAS